MAKKYINAKDFYPRYVTDHLEADINFLQSNDADKRAEALARVFAVRKQIDELTNKYRDTEMTKVQLLRNFFNLDEEQTAKVDNAIALAVHENANIQNLREERHRVADNANIKAVNSNIISNNPQLQAALDTIDKTSVIKLPDTDLSRYTFNIRGFIGEKEIPRWAISTYDFTVGYMHGLAGAQGAYSEKSDVYKLGWNLSNNATGTVVDAIVKVAATAPPTLPGGRGLTPRMAIAGEGLVPRTPTVAAPASAVPILYSSAGDGKSNNTKSSEPNNTGRNVNVQKQESPVWKNLDNVKGKDRKTSGTGKDQRYYEWDYTHNDIEVYNNRGQHIGSMNPVTGEIYKPRVEGRRIEL